MKQKIGEIKLTKSDGLANNQQGLSFKSRSLQFERQREIFPLSHWVPSRFLPMAEMTMETTCFFWGLEGSPTGKIAKIGH